MLLLLFFGCFTFNPDGYSLRKCRHTQKTTQCKRVSDKSVPIDIASSLAMPASVFCGTDHVVASWTTVDVTRTFSVNVGTGRWSGEGMECVRVVVSSYPCADIRCGWVENMNAMAYVQHVLHMCIMYLVHNFMEPFMWHDKHIQHISSPHCIGNYVLQYIPTSSLMLCLRHLIVGTRENNIEN